MRFPVMPGRLHCFAQWKCEAYFVRKVVEDMAIIYAQLIIKGKRTFESVPALVKPQVKEILTDMELPELAAE